MNQETKPINAFSPDYVQKITAFKPKRFKLPVLTQPRYPHMDNIAPSEEGKRARLFKASI